MPQAYVRFANLADAEEAWERLAGRKFCERTLITTFYDEAAFDKGVLL